MQRSGIAFLLLFMPFLLGGPAFVQEPASVSSQLSLDGSRVAAHSGQSPVVLPPLRHGPSTMEVYLVIEGEPAAKVALATKSQPAAVRTELVRERLEEIEAEQDFLSQAIKSLGAQEITRYRRLANAIQARVPVDQVSRIAELPGVVRVEPVPSYGLDTGGSTAFLGAPVVWNPSGLNVRGEGIRIGIIDTGIDYYHASFGGTGSSLDYAGDDSTVIEPGTFPTVRIVGGYDFAGDDYDANSSDPAHYTPNPDPDPLDCHGHGTHVAGIAAGNGVLLNGQSFTGPWGPGLDRDDFRVAPGMAPKAELYALKIFGCEGSTHLVGAALEWAADPNDDGDFSDRLDVVNLSVGSPFGGISQTEGEIVQTLAELGCVIVGSAGNNGNTFYISGGVNLLPEAIGVANTMDDGRMFASVQVTSPSAVAGAYPAVEATITPPLAGMPPVSGQLLLASPANACVPLLNATQMNGKIALIDRGGCTFAEKILHAQAAGAIAVMVADNTPGLPWAMGGESAGITTPAVMISQADGMALKPHLGAGVQVTIPGPPLILEDLALQAVGSSSRGPTMFDHRIKPDLAAPGFEIESTDAGSGTGKVAMTGTSMSAPHVAGAAALLKQLHPGEPPAVTKARLMNTAEGALIDGHTSPVSRTGAGSMNVERAATTPAIVFNRDKPAEVSLSWGLLKLAGPHTGTRHLRIANLSPAERTYPVQVLETSSQEGVTVGASVPEVTVPPGGTVDIEITLQADPAALTRTVDPTTGAQLGLPRSSLWEASGYVQLGTGAEQLRVPYYAVLDAIGNGSAPTTMYLGKASSGTHWLEEKSTTTVTVPIAGTNAHPAPRVSAFQLGHLSEDMGLENPYDASVDLLAVGAMSNVGVLPTFDQGTLFFGIATASDWPAPRNRLGEIVILLDVGGNGTLDAYLINVDYGSVTGQNPSDSFVTYRHNVAGGTGHVEYFTNMVSPDQVDTGLFNNSVLMMGIPINVLGLSPSNPVIDYKVVTWSGVDDSLVDETPFIRYDLSKRTMITASPGFAPLKNVAAGSFSMDVDEAALAANPELNTLLLLHHHNAPGGRMQVVEFSLDPAPNEREAWLLF